MDQKKGYQLALNMPRTAPIRRFFRRKMDICKLDDNLQSPLTIVPPKINTFFRLVRCHERARFGLHWYPGSLKPIESSLQEIILRFARLLMRPIVFLVV